MVGRDVHKPGNPRVVESVGLSYLISSNLTLLSYSLITGEYLTKTLVFVASSTYIGIVGLIDDFKTLSGGLKVILTLLGIIPIVVFGAYTPYPYLPFIGRARITIVYLLLLPLAVAVTSNAANMMDTYNGSLASTSTILFSSLLISSLVGFWRGYVDCFGALASSTLVGGLLGFLPYNKYPARVFNGDVGSLYVGACISLVAILGRLEIVALVAMMPYILNGFHILVSIKGFRERRTIQARPVRVDFERMVLKANLEDDAPITLAHLILLKNPMNEVELVNSMILLQAVASILAVITSLLTFS